MPGRHRGRLCGTSPGRPLPPAAAPSDEYELTETRAFDTYSGQEVLVRQVPLPEVVEAEVLDTEGLPEGFTARDSGARRSNYGPRAAAPGGPPTRSYGVRSRPRRRRPPSPTIRGWTRSSTCSRRAVRCG
ncbi:hypothetical protein SHKM778_10070 [Streptomyces sp. KM77-8]|uniref:Uncharacterized protein n=1 Tax=Streptomyces haneummycinicus TaxID=3074435 RepID=A0AAT9HB52_9ACTN